MHLSTRSDKGDRQVLQAVFCGTCNKDCLVQGAMRHSNPTTQLTSLGGLCPGADGSQLSSPQPHCSGTQRPPLTAGCRDQRSCTARALTLHSAPMVSSCARKALWRIIIIPCVGLSAGLLCRTMLSRPSHIRIRQGSSLWRPFLACLLPQRMCSSVMASFLAPRLLTHDPGCRLGSDRGAGDSSAAHQPEACHAQSQAL